MVIAIDGPAGTGKSTVARYVARHLEFLYVNSGALYRAVTWNVLERADDPDDPGQIVAAARALRVYVDDGALRIAGVEDDRSLYEHRIDSWVSRHSALPEVRETVNTELRALSKGHDLVVEGRDIQTAVFPDAEVKVYLDAGVETRARRRFDQGFTDRSLEEIRAGIEARDEDDRTKRTGALRMAADAVYLDTSDLTIDEVCETVMNNIQRQEYFQELQGNHE
ncbi:MAG: (d)CMP kinase [Spirochaetaceae bacterium]